MDILKPLGYEFQIVGPNNLYVINEKVYAFEREIDVILRLYPTEFLYEVKNFEDVVELFNKGKVLIINDPRVIIAQTKSLFAYLWELVLDKDAFLSEREVSVIKNTIPFTKYFDKEYAGELYNDKDKYVIKAAFGRYSEEVYIGKMCDPKEWKEVIDYVLESDKLHIIQEFCPIKNEEVLMFGNTCYKHQSAFGNFGIYLTNGSFSGVCVRWSPDYLSYDETIWSSPVGIRAENIKICTPSLADRESVWQQINDEALFKWNFTGGFTADYESFTLQSLILSKEIFNELKYATEQFVEIFKKTTRLVQENVGVFGPVLGIDDKLLPLITQDFTDVLTFIGRLDWVIDTKGKLKLLEMNSETPAGLLESMFLNNLIMHKTNLADKYTDPNTSLGIKIKDVFKKIVSDYEKVKDIKNIGFVTNSYYEDWYNTTVLFDLVKDLPYNFVLGEVSGLCAKDNKIYLYDKPLDAMYRYYPLDWFNSDDYFRGVVDGLRFDCLSINPPKTFISQSKALFALVWELVDTDYYSENEKDVIKKYMSKTALSYEKLGITDFCMKPYFGREGEGIGFSIDESIFSLEGNEYVFQERVDIQTAQLDLYSTTSRCREVCYPLIGTYIVGDKFEGIYTRAGGIVTNKHALFLPTFTLG
jgi:glutathionylspermidine synthase